MIRNELFRDGVCVAADIIDLDAGTFIREEHGVIISTRLLTADERAAYGPPALDPVGALATLLAVNGVLPVADAANAVGVEPDRLVSEAQAWAVAQQLGGQP